MSNMMDIKNNLKCNCSYGILCCMFNIGEKVLVITIFIVIAEYQFNTTAVSFQNVVWLIASDPMESFFM